METRAMVDIHDWQNHHVILAATQGWCISETGELGGAPLEIQRLDDAAAASRIMGVIVPQLAADDDAVQIFKESYIRGDDHARLAYSIIKMNSPKEYEQWRMMKWQIEVS